MLEWHRRLIALRASEPGLRDGAAAATSVRHDAGAGWLVVDRGSLTVAVNLAAAQVLPAATGEVLLTNDADAAVTERGLRLGRDAVAILRRQSG
jgi:maltooligosyltrehalose trehalohydrolase